MGPTHLPDYVAALDIFAASSFPHEVAQKLKFGLAVYLAGVNGQTPWDSEKYIWQTDKDHGKKSNWEVRSWSAGQAQNEGWKWDLLSDEYVLNPVDAKRSLTATAMRISTSRSA